ncbi:MAG: HD-GYP domain-containing protein [Candidatus Dormibacteria bacterium]
MPRVLVAEDDPLVRRLLQRCLEGGGYDVVLAVDGMEAIRALTGGAALDVVVTDQQMPGADGIAVITAARRVDPALPCVVVTAMHDLDLAMRAMAAGAVNFIPKPFKAEHLLTVVASAMERRAISTESLRLRLLAPMLERFTMLLANTLEAKDISTSDHCERLVQLADATACALGLDILVRGHIRLGACLHDLGKVAIPEALLRKPGPLTAEETDVMRRHPVIGAEILEDIEAWREVRQIVRHHHEHVDGSGYPGGLMGSRIPLGARIVSVVDAFDVMRSGRPYQAALPVEYIVEELRGLRGRQFDGDCVDAFLASLTPEMSRSTSGARTPAEHAGDPAGFWLGPSLPRAPAMRMA